MIKGENKDPLEPWVSTAIWITMKSCHGKYRRDGRTSAFIHPMRVAMRVSQHGPDAVAVAWLHDVLEDDESWTPERLLKEGIPARVIDSVKRLTHQPDQTYMHYIDGVKQDAVAKQVKIADILDNLSDTPSVHQVRKYATALTWLLDEGAE